MYEEAQVIVKSGKSAALLKRDHSLTPFRHHLISSWTENRVLYIYLFIHTFIHSLIHSLIHLSNNL